jgi:hypothetical protein
MVLLEKRIENKENSLEFDKLHKKLNLRFERLSIQSESSNENRENEDQALITVQLKG